MEFTKSEKIRVRGRNRLHLVEEEVPDVGMTRLGPRPGARRVERPTGLFKLASGLSGPGEMTLDDVATMMAIDWSRQIAEGNIDEVVARNYLRDTKWFLAWARTRGSAELRDLTADMVLEWLHSPLPDGRSAAKNTRNSAYLPYEHCSIRVRSWVFGM